MTSAAEFKEVWYLVLLAIVEVVYFFGVYKEYKGHEEVLSGVDDDIAELWGKLWKAWIICFGVIIIVGGFLYLLNSALIFTFMLVATIAMVILELLKLVMFYKTAAAFSIYLEYYPKKLNQK